MPAFLTRPLRFLPRGPLDLVIQFAIVFAAYELYRLTRGAVDDPLAAQAAFRNAATILDIEQALHLDVELWVQRTTERVWGLPELASFLYINVQTTVTFSVMAWVYVRHNPRFALVRNMFILNWFIALIVFVLLPTAPPRLVSGLGFTDSVAVFTGVDPNATRIGAFYNPYAALPSLHVGVAALVGASVAMLAERRAVRIAWALYPVLVTFLVLATGNHWTLDAAAGAAVALVAAVIARQLALLRGVVWGPATQNAG